MLMMERYFPSDITDRVMVSVHSHSSQLGPGVIVA